MSDSSERPITTSVEKKTRRFAPTVRGRGRARKGAETEATTNAPAASSSSTTDSPTAPTPSPSSIPKNIGHMRPESSEGRLPSVHDGQKTRGGSTKVRRFSCDDDNMVLTSHSLSSTSSAIDDALRTNIRGGDRGRGDRGRGGRGRGGRGRGRGRGIVVEELGASGIFSLGPSAMSSRGRNNAYAGGGGGFATYGNDSHSRPEGESGVETDMTTLFNHATDGNTPVVFAHVSRLESDVDPIDLSVPTRKVPWLTMKSEPEKPAVKKEEDKSIEDDKIVVKQEPGTESLESISSPMEVDEKARPSEETTAEESAAEEPTTEEPATEESTEEEPTVLPEVFMDDDAPAQNIFALNEKSKLVSVADDELLFFQLPSILPRFEAPSTTDEGMEDVKIEEGKEAQLPTAAKKATLEEAMASLALEDLPEGRIGKLVVYKSGKIKLKLGDVLLDVSQGMRSTFLENVMVVDIESETKKTIELGHVVQKFVCAPDMEALLKDCE
ncbi:DNA-directed RNA polymerase III subunit RPC4 [Apophysomyces sp. BC1021]|nr:DNA-directed RNA polymerase III subunit RPC4 [Apophysomyces sp. BC1021]